MKIRIADRILVAAAGLVLIALAVGVVAQTVFDVELIAFFADKLARFMETERVWTTVAVVIGAALLLLLGLYCLGVLVRHEKKGKRGFVMQKTETGELSISIKAIDGLVQKCVDRHEEIKVLSTALESTRDGLIVKLRIGLAGGVNIPLAVAALQKQIKQYVTSCSGVDVKEVKVRVENSDADGAESRYSVPLLPEKAEPLPVVEEAAESAAPEAEEAPAEKKRPLHQRLFGHGEEPVTVPAPPATEPEPEASAEPESAAEEAPEGENAPVAELAEDDAEAEIAEAEAEEPATAEEDAPVAESEAMEEADEQEEATDEDAE